MLIYYCSIFILIFVGIFAADKSVTVGDITTKVKGRSGKISISKGGNETDGVTCTYDAIEEIDTDGGNIQSHSYNNFAQLDFTFSDPENGTYKDSNVSVTHFSFKADIDVDGSNAKLTSYVFIFTMDGNITVDGQNVMVKAGDMKFNARIEGWQFCDTCSKGNKEYTGEYLDFSVEIKGKKPPNATDSGSFDLGDGSTVITPKEVLFDNSTIEDMPAGYPKLVTKGSKQIFIFRFRKFNSSVLYDPVVSIGGESGGNGGNDTDGGETTTETDMTASGVSAKVLGNSGKVTLQNEGSTGDSKKSITLEFDNLSEKKSDGSAVKESSHVTNTFANQPFTFKPIVEEEYPGTSIGVQRLTFESALKNGASLKVHMYIFKESGDIVQENETVSVKAGNVKINIDITSWSFCDGSSSCKQNEMGEYLDFDIVMKGKSGSAARANSESGNTYTLGDSGSTMLSRKIKVDGAADLVDMATDYPKLITQGSKQIFRFRFPKFTTSILYDPTIFLNPDGTNSAVKETISAFMLAAVGVLFYML